MALSFLTCPGRSLQRRRFGAKAKTMQQRASQAYTTMGRPVHHHRGAKAWNLEASQREGSGLHQHFVHRAATSLLPLSSQALCIFFISKTIKNHSLLVILSRSDPDLLAGSEASFLYHAIRARPDPTTGKAEPPLGARWGGPPPSPNDFSFLSPNLSLAPWQKTVKFEGAR
jgi:hypothetical protein